MSKQFEKVGQNNEDDCEKQKRYAVNMPKGAFQGISGAHVT